MFLLDSVVDYYLGCIVILKVFARGSLSFDCKLVVWRSRNFHLAFKTSINLYVYVELQAILNGFFAEFPQAVRGCVESVVNAASEIYSRMSSDFLPTPAKSHYVFNLRDLSKCVQGM